MTITKCYPIKDMVGLRNRFNRLCADDFFGNIFDTGEESLANLQPSTDIYETQDEYVLKMEIPGVMKEDVNIELKDNTLIIKGEKKEQKEVNEENYHRMETRSGSFCRSFSIPHEVDANKINASMKDGVLELKLIKAEEKKAKNIPIKIN